MTSLDRSVMSRAGAAKTRRAYSEQSHAAGVTVTPSAVLRSARMGERPSLLSLGRFMGWNVAEAQETLAEKSLAAHVSIIRCHST